MTEHARRPEISGSAPRRWTRRAGWGLIAVGIVVSWVWSVELTIAGESVNAATAGAATMLLFCAGVVLIWRASSHRGRTATMAFRAGAIAITLGAIAAGIIPLAVLVTTTGTVTSHVTSGRNGDGYRVAGTAIASSDTYGQTTLDLTVRASDRTTPQLIATVSFTDGAAPVTCTNTRQGWTHDISTVEMICERLVPRASLDAISGIAVSAQ